jgi:hypothetical protein
MSALPVRSLPHSAESEAAVIGCCFLDGAESFERSLSARITASTFWAPQNGLIWDAMAALRQQGHTIELGSVFAELQGKGLHEKVGGIPYLVQVSSLTGTTAQLDTHIKQLRDCEIRRDIIKRCSSAVEMAFSTDSELSEMVKPIVGVEDSVSRLTTPLKDIAKPLGDFPYPVVDENVLLGTKHRYLCRGGGLLIPAAAGVGKSTLSYQMGACFGAGRDFLGLDCMGPLRVLIVQGEDDDGDIGEVVESVKQGLNFSQKEWEMVNRNVKVIRDKVNTGESFLVALRSYVQEFNPDLVVINPIMQYCPGLSKEEVAGPFFYGGLNSINAKQRFAYIIFHHTPKPPVDNDKNKGRSGHAVDRQYTAFGSSLLTNFFRAIINVTPIRNEKGTFVFSFDKRGTRAGLTKSVSHGMGTRLESTTEIKVCHSQRHIEINGVQRPMILWEKAVDDTPPPVPMEDRVIQGGRSKGWSESELIEVYPLGIENRKGILEIQKTAMITRMIPKSSFMVSRVDLLQDGAIVMHADGRYYRPSANDSIRSMDEKRAARAKAEQPIIPMLLEDV